MFDSWMGTLVDIVVYVIPLIIVIILLLWILNLVSKALMVFEKKLTKALKGSEKKFQAILKSLKRIDFVVTFLNFFPYVIVIYYLLRFSMYIFNFGAWGYTGETFVASAVRDSTLSMTELLLLEGVPVVLVAMIGSSALKIVYKFFANPDGDKTGDEKT